MNNTNSEHSPLTHSMIYHSSDSFASANCKLQMTDTNCPDAKLSLKMKASHWPAGLNPGFWLAEAIQPSEGSSLRNDFNCCTFSRQLQPSPISLLVHIPSPPSRSSSSCSDNHQNTVVQDFSDHSVAIITPILIVMTPMTIVTIPMTNIMTPVTIVMTPMTNAMTLVIYCFGWSKTSPH